MNKFIASILVSTLLCSVNVYSQQSEMTFEVGKRHASDLKRDKMSHGQEVVELANLKEGMIVFDLLGGGGYYSELIANQIGKKGRVYLHNNKAYMPWVEKELVARLANNRLPNVFRYDRETDALNLQESGFDAVFFMLGYHDMYHVAKDWKIDKDSFLTEFTRAVKPGGKLVIVDHSAKAGTGVEASQDLHRIDVNYVIEEVKSKGFKLIEQSNLLANPKDNRTISPFKPEMRRKTDRFVLVFKKQ